MKAGLLIAAALLIGALLASIVATDPGYVGIRIAHHLLEMSVPTAALLLFAVYFCVQLLLRALRSRRMYAQAQLERRRQRARRALERGVLELAEGNWAIAEDTVTQSIQDAEAPAAHYLLAARAAALQGLTQRRDDWLVKALEAAPERRAPALISQAEFYLKNDQIAAAQAALDQLEASGERSSRALVLQARIHRQRGAWQALQELAPRLRNLPGIPATLTEEIQAQIYLDTLKAAGSSHDPAKLKDAWEAVPKRLLERPDVAVSYARAALACGEPTVARAVLTDLLDQHWDEPAILLYGEIEDDPFPVLEKAETWLPDHPKDPGLLLTCARLSIRAELYGKARSYLETSLGFRPRLDAYYLLANLFEQLGERDLAFRALNDGLLHAAGRKLGVPKLRAQRQMERRRQRTDRRRS
jgi:HemY protein